MTEYRQYNDIHLSVLLMKGDHAAFNEIHQRYYPLLYRHAYKRLPSEEDVKDILQELFAALWNNRETLNLPAGLAPYLYTAVRNRVINAFSKQKVRLLYARSLQQYLEEGENVTDLKLREKELIALVEKEIAALPPRMREVFELSRHARLSHQEIADLLKTSPQTVRKQVQNALRILRAKLGASVFSIFF